MAGSAKRVPLVDGAAWGAGGVNGATRGMRSVDMAACGTGRVDGAACGAGRMASGGVEVDGATHEGGEATRGVGNGARRGA
jgi:hypothetical protein